MPLLKLIGTKYNIICPLFRPLWLNPGQIEILSDWSLLKEDMVNFLINLNKEKHNILGHSLGGHIAFRISLENPSLIKKLVLMDPIIFPKIQMFLWKFIQWTDLGVKLHPMIQASKNQKMVHDSIESIINKYRNKNIFKNINDENLMYLVNGLIKYKDDRKVEIIYPKDWELRIYQSGGISDKYIWKNIKNLKTDTMIYHAEKTHAPSKKIVKLLKNKSDYIESKFINRSTHFFPFEIPKELSKDILRFLL